MTDLHFMTAKPDHASMSLGNLTVGIIGLGYVGIPLSSAFARNNIDVIGFDVDNERVSCLNNGESPIRHISSDEIKSIRSSGKFVATTSFSEISQVDAILICVPTPLAAHNEPDVSYIVNAVDSILPYLKKGQLICLESTTYPGTTEEVIVTKIVEKGFTLFDHIRIGHAEESVIQTDVNFDSFGCRHPVDRALDLAGCRGS